MLEFLRRHSSTPLSQALEYLVADVARRHGRLRVGGATTYLRGDPAMVAGAVRSAAGRRLGLRELAPGVAVTGRSQRELLAALRKAGEAPWPRSPTAALAPRGPPRPPRAAGSPRPPGPGRGRPQRPRRRRPGMDPATVVDRLRGRRPVPATGTDQRVARG